MPNTLVQLPACCLYKQFLITNIRISLLVIAFTLNLLLINLILISEKVNIIYMFIKQICVLCFAFFAFYAFHCFWFEYIIHIYYFSVTFKIPLKTINQKNLQKKNYILRLLCAMIFFAKPPAIPNFGTLENMTKLKLKKNYKKQIYNPKALLPLIESYIFFMSLRSR